MRRARRFRLASPGLWAGVLGSLAGLALTASVPLTVLSGQLGNGIVALVIGIPCAGIGLVVARRQPGNALGWLFLTTATCLLVSNDGGDYSYLIYRLGHPHLPFGPVALVMDQLWTVGLTLFVVVMLLFPDGRLSSASWRWALRAFGALYVALVGVVAVVTADALAVRPVHVDAFGGLSAVNSPHGWFAVVEHTILLLLLALSLAFIGHQALSWRRSSGDRRQQLKWLASGAAISIVSVVIAVPLSSGTSALMQWASNVAWFGLAALPLSMGVAILRYRLYDIDRIISRTLAYTLVTGLLVGVYAGFVLLTNDVLSLSSPVAVAASTLVAAALFNPLRRQVQRVVDRRFNRARYDADRTVAAFAGRLNDAVDLDAVQANLAGVVARTLEPAHVSIWVNGRS